MTSPLKRKARGSRARMPILEPSSDRPINLNFPQPKPVKQIYKALGDAAGINVIFDPQLKDENVTIVLTNMEFQTALETLMRQENHFYKVIDERTILIAADNPANRKTYEDLVIRTFFLSNADVTEVANSLRSLLQTTRISVNKAENSITLRDTADKVAIAERIVEQNDKQLAEVVVDVELLQMNTTKTQDLGVLLSAYETKGTLVAPSPAGKTNFDTSVPAGNFTWDQLKQHLDPLVRVHYPVLHVLLHQEQHGRRAARQAPAADLGGPEGAAAHRRQGADSRPRRSTPGDGRREHRARSRPSSTRTSASRSRSSPASTTTRRSR